MKKLIALLLTIVMVFSLAACGSDTDTKDNSSDSSVNKGSVTMGKLPENPPAKPSFTAVGENGQEPRMRSVFSLNCPKWAKK